MTDLQSVRLFTVSTLLICTFALAACKPEGSVEKAGRKIDDAADSISEGKNPLRTPGPLEKAGEAVDEAVDDVKKESR